VGEATGLLSEVAPQPYEDVPKWSFWHDPGSTASGGSRNVSGPGQDLERCTKSTIVDFVHIWSGSGVLGQDRGSGSIADM